MLRIVEGMLYAALMYGVAFVAYAAAHRHFLPVAAEVAATVLALLPVVGCLYLLLTVVYTGDRSRSLGLLAGAALFLLLAIAPAGGP